MRFDSFVNFGVEEIKEEDEQNLHEKLLSEYSG